MEKNWVLIYSSDKINDIETVKSFLAENNINAVDINKKDSAYLFGEIELYVNQKDAFTAKQIINKNNL